MGMDERDVRIGQVVVDMEITEGIGPLGPQEVRLVALVLEQVRREQSPSRSRARYRNP
jgi:hypothetical protein